MKIYQHTSTQKSYEQYAMYYLINSEIIDYTKTLRDLANNKCTSEKR